MDTIARRDLLLFAEKLPTPLNTELRTLVDSHFEQPKRLAALFRAKEYNEATKFSTEDPDRVTCDSIGSVFSGRIVSGAD